MALLASLAWTGTCQAQESVSDSVARYQACSLGKAFPLISSGETARDIALTAVGLCESHIKDIDAAVREEKKDHPHLGSYAQGYTSSIKTRMVDLVASRVMEFRAK